MKDKNNQKGKANLGSAKSSIRRAFPKKRAISIKFSFTNMLLLFIVIFIGYFLLSTALAPDKGREIGVDEFVSNIKEDEYSQVDIEFSGDAIGRGKYLAQVELENLGQIDEDNLRVRKESDIEDLSLDELLDKLDSTDYSARVKDVFRGGRNGIVELVFLNEGILARTTVSIDEDYFIENSGEEELFESLESRDLSREDLNLIYTLFRSAGFEIEQENFLDSVESDTFEYAWQIGDTVYAKKKTKKIDTTYVTWKGFTGDFAKFLQDEEIDFAAKNVEIASVYNPPVSFETILWIVAMGALVFAVVMLAKAMQGQGSGLMQFGKSKAKLFFGKKPEATFKDVAGVDEAKKELNEVVMFLKDSKRFTALGARIPKGVLMVGAPGTGKTLLARAIAGEAGVPFFHTSGAEFEEMLVGAGASRVRDLFEKAKKSAPSLIFIDEIDAIARKRGTTVQSSHTEQTLNQILTEMDGFDTNQNVIVIAATNRPDVLDPAILRPGRFDRRIVLDLPDIEGRKEILAIHSKNKPLSEEVDLEKVAKRTVGFSGADLENTLNEAAIIAAIDNRKEINPDDIEEAATKVVAGPEKKRKRDKGELKMTAYHEAGHAIVAKLTPKSDPVHRISIISRGMALGITMQLPEKDKYQQTMQELVSRIKVLMGGRAAEEMIFGDISSGASNDIEKATSIARRMVKQFGMSKKLGLVKYGISNDLQYLGYGYGEQRDYSDNTADDIDDEVKRIINESYEVAKKILQENKDKLEKIVNLLMEKEVIESDEFEGLFKS